MCAAVFRSMNKKYNLSGFWGASFLLVVFLLSTSSVRAENRPPKGGQPKPAEAGSKSSASGSASSASSENKGAGSLKGLFQESPTAGGGGPLFIKSDTLELNSKSRVFVYKGNVEVVRDDVTITANMVEGQYDAQNRLQTIISKGDVVITKGDSMKSTANRAVYNVAAATIVLTEGPELYRDGNALAADKVIMYVNEDRSEAEGNVRVKVVKPEEASR